MNSMSRTHWIVKKAEKLSTCSHNPLKIYSQVAKSRASLTTSCLTLIQSISRKCQTTYTEDNTFQVLVLTVNCF